MGEGAEAIENGNGNGNGWMSKARAAGIFINQVGIPAVIILFFLIVLGAVVFGKVDSPVVTRGQFKDAMERNIEMHRAIIETAEANTSAAEKTAKVLDRINCELKHADIEKLKCFRDIQSN
jgi:hypothetical protein